MAYGSGTLFQRGKKGTWYYQAYVDGQQIGPLSAKTSDRKKAQIQLDKLIGKRGRGEVTASSLASGRDTLGEILDGYIKYAHDNLGEDTAYIYEKTINAHLRKPFGSVAAAKLTSKKLEQYRVSRKTGPDKASDSTINRELSCLRAALRLAVKKGHTIPVPWFPMVNEEKFTRQTYKEEEEFLKFLEALGDDLKPFACCAYYGGMRRGELVKLELRDIDIPRRIISVRFTKNKTSRNVPIYEGPMLQWLQWLWKHRQPGQTQAFVFADGRPVTLRNFYHKWHAATKESGIGYFIPHDSRRSSNRRLAKEGVPQALRKKLHGWKTDDMDHRYGIVDTADAEMVRNLIDSRRRSEITAKTTASVLDPLG